MTQTNPNLLETQNCVTVLEYIDAVYKKIKHTTVRTTAVQQTRKFRQTQDVHERQSTSSPYGIYEFNFESTTRISLDRTETDTYEIAQSTLSQLVRADSSLSFKRVAF